MTNLVYDHCNELFVAVPSGTVSGDPVADGVGIVGVALIDRDANGNASIKTRPITVVRLSVFASTDDASAGAGASAVARGDLIYKATATEVVSKDTGGTLFGYALGTRDANGAYADGTQVTSGETASCDVILA